MNRGELTEFVSYKEAKHKEPKEERKKLAPIEVEKLIALKDDSEALGKVGKFLNTPVSSYGGYPNQIREGGMFGEVSSGEKAAGVAMSIVYIIIRLLLSRFGG